METALTKQDSSLAIAGPRQLTPEVWQMVKELAPVIHQSRLFGVSSIDQAAAIMLKGFDLGLPFTASFEFIKVIQSVPGLIPRGALALLLNAPQIEKINITRLEKNGAFHGYECYMRRVGGFEFTARFTLDDAKRAQLIKPDSGWEKYPENMAMWRAVGFAADVVAPDITAGLTAFMKMPEQLGIALSEGGDIIDMPQNAPQAAPQTPTAVPAVLKITLDDLIDAYGAEAILAANEGKIPGTEDEVQALASKLAGGA